MAYINVDEVYILDNTGLQVDMATDIPFADAGFSDDQKAQARKNIAAGGSNRNLLDNAYFVGGGSQLGDGVFPINQRGQTSYSGGQCIDRWYGDGAVTINASGLSSPIAAFMQMQTHAFFDRLWGKTFTASVMYTDGTIESGTATWPASIPASVTLLQYGNTGLATAFYTNNESVGGQLMRFNKSNVAAVKLELGTVSTLANDPPPNFAEEFEKCRYYLRYIPLTRYAIAIDGANAYMTMIGMPMHGVPTPSLVTAGGVRDAGGTSTITSATVTGFAYKIPTVQFALSASRSYVVGYIYDTVLCLSAEL